MVIPYRYHVALSKTYLDESGLNDAVREWIITGIDNGDFDELIRVRVQDNPDLIDGYIVAEQIANGDWDDSVTERMAARR
jgi:hypothetical protein